MEEDVYKRQDMDRLSVHAEGDELAAAVIIISGNVGDGPHHRGKMFKIHKEKSFFVYHMQMWGKGVLVSWERKMCIRDR